MEHRTNSDQHQNQVCSVESQVAGSWEGTVRWLSFSAEWFLLEPRVPVLTPWGVLHKWCVDTACCWRGFAAMRALFTHQPLMILFFLFQSLAARYVFRAKAGCKTRPQSDCCQCGRTNTRKIKYLERSCTRPSTQMLRRSSCSWLRPISWRLQKAIPKRVHDWLEHHKSRMPVARFYMQSLKCI